MKDYTQMSLSLPKLSKTLKEKKKTWIYKNKEKRIGDDSHNILEMEIQGEEGKWVWKEDQPEANQFMPQSPESFRNWCQVLLKEEIGLKIGQMTDCKFCKKWAISQVPSPALCGQATTIPVLMLCRCVLDSGTPDTDSHSGVSHHN